MEIHRYLAGATVALALAVAGPANAGLLGGSAVGAVDTTLSGRMGDVGGMADGGVTGSIGAQTNAIDRAGEHTRAIGGRVNDRTRATAGAAKDRADSTSDHGREAVVGASTQATATAAAGVESGVDQSISAHKSLEAGDRTVAAMATSSAQGEAGARRDSETLDLTGSANAQSAAAVKTGRKAEQAAAPEPMTDRNDRR
jgi:hypothetical protein